MQNGSIDSFASMPAMNVRRSARCFCRDFKNITRRYFLYNKQKVTTAVTFSVTRGLAHGCDNLKKTTKHSKIKYMNFTFRDFDPISYMEKWHDMLDHSGGMCIKESVTSYDRVRMR